MEAQERLQLHHQSHGLSLSLSLCVRVSIRMLGFREKPYLTNKIITILLLLVSLLLSESNQFEENLRAGVSFNTNSRIACPVQGMERVVATVSRYHGAERFNLIKLISHSGANYVGAMSKSITHLVCWKFEGRKYDIARKFNIIIVNHRWIEDCIKEGKRVPEDSYTVQSGEEVGPLLLEVPLTVQASILKKNKAISNRLYDIGSGMQTTEFSSGASGDSVWEDFYLINKHEESSAYSSRRSRKEKRSICDGSGVSGVAGPSRKGRRVVENIVDEVVLDPLLDLSPEAHLNRLERRQHDAAATSSLSGGVNNENILENREAPDAGLYNQSGTINGASDCTDQIEHLNNISTLRSSTLSVDDLSMMQTSLDACSVAEKFTDGDHDENVAGLPKSSELSCVICLADFSSTRGILLCGHRFCFECIQSWVDHRTSMGKGSTCPLCKASIGMIKKVEDAATTDQKIYSQTVPCDNSAKDIFIPTYQELPDYGFESSDASACVVCRRLEPEDLLERCDVCRTRSIHVYCLDPLLLPWTCNPCKELRRIHRNHAY